MTVRRYAVLDSTRKCVNIILVDDPMPVNYWPGYGSALIHLGPADPNEPYSAPTIVSCELRTPSVTPTSPLQIGDTIDVQTGEVTKWQPRIIQQRDADGVVRDVSEAPTVRLYDERTVALEPRVR